MTTNDQILSAIVGYQAKNYSGDKGPLRRTEWRAKLDAAMRGDGWYVREVKQPLLIVSRETAARVLSRI